MVTGWGGGGGGVDFIVLLKKMALVHLLASI